MNDLLQSSSELLREAGYVSERTTIGRRDALAFEGNTVLGFVFKYDSIAELIGGWVADSDNAVAAYQFGLRRSGIKAWNTYLVLLTSEVPKFSQSIALSAIEEDLSGTRKIVRSGVRDGNDLSAALLPLLPLQSAPRLEAVDIKAEIRERATELPTRIVDAFLSDADESVVLQVLEELP